MGPLLFDEIVERARDFVLKEQGWLEKRDQSRVTYWEQVDADLDEITCAMICENLGETITKFFL